MEISASLQYRTAFALALKTAVIYGCDAIFLTGSKVVEQPFDCSSVPCSFSANTDRPE